MTRQRAVSEAKALVGWLGRVPDSVCDIACGDGRHLAEFSRLGVKRGYGFDANYELSEKAKSNVANGNYSIERKTFSSWVPPRKKFDLVYSLFSSLGHCASSKAAESLVCKAASAVKKGGMLCLDLDNVFRLARVMEKRQERLMKTNEKFVFDAVDMVLVSEDVRAKNILVSETRYFTAREIREMLVRSGFRRTSIIFKGGFSGEEYSTESRRLIVLAKK